MNLLLFFGIFILMNFLIWMATNSQLIEGADQKKSLIICIVLAVPISLLAFYGTKVGYVSLGSAWSVRLTTFGISYLVFPFMTYFYLSESPFNLKTMICIVLSVAIICVQTILPNN